MKYHVDNKIITIYYYSCLIQTNLELVQWTVKINYDRNNLRKGKRVWITVLIFLWVAGRRGNGQVDFHNKKTVQILEK